MTLNDLNIRKISFKLILQEAVYYLTKKQQLYNWLINLYGSFGYIKALIKKILERKHEKISEIF